MKKTFLILFFYLLFDSLLAQKNEVFSQNTESTSITALPNKKIYSEPSKATIMSLFIPGMGQVYNKKIWKVPIIYSALGGFGYMFYSYNKLYVDYRSALQKSIEYGGTYFVENRSYTTDQLQSQKLYYKKYRDFAIIGFGLVYIINLIDANVDGHLKTFDVSDDLSIQISPWQDVYNSASNNYHSISGISIKINFK